MTALEAKQLGVRRGENWVVRGANFEVPDGAFVAVLGPNGAGKTSLLLSIMGLLKPDEGEVQLFGAAASAAAADTIGYVPQTKELDRSFPAKAWEVVASGQLRRWPGIASRRYRDAALVAMESAGVAGLEDRAVSTLSGGELQRVYLARCFVREPKLMLLDEPATGMDVAGEAAMYHLLERYQKQHNATVMMVTHDWEGARLHASHVLILSANGVLFAQPDAVPLEEQLLHIFGHRGHAKESHRHA